MDIPHQSGSSENGCLFFREDAPPPRAVVISFPDAWVRRQANLGMMGERQYKPAERPKVIRAAGGPGAPALVLESLPGDQTDEGQKDQEYAILEKFIAALRHFDGRDISGRYREGDGWPDFETGEGAGALGIEITSVTYEPHDDLERLEERYARRGIRATRRRSSTTRRTSLPTCAGDRSSQRACRRSRRRPCPSRAIITKALTGCRRPARASSGPASSATRSRIRSASHSKARTTRPDA
jgi:hypothetical protein